MRLLLTRGCWADAMQEAHGPGSLARGKRLDFKDKMAEDRKEVSGI